jgi:hypothetical protein
MSEGLQQASTDLREREVPPQFRISESVCRRMFIHIYMECNILSAISCNEFMGKPMQVSPNTLLLAVGIHTCMRAEVM